MARKLILVGFMVFVSPGSLLQLMWALQISIFCLAVTVQSSPFRNDAGKYCSLVSSLATITTLLMCIVLQTSHLVESLGKNTNVQASLFEFLEFDLWLAVAWMFAATIAVAAVVSLFLWCPSRAGTVPETLSILHALEPSLTASVVRSPSCSRFSIKKVQMWPRARHLRVPGGGPQTHA